MRYILLCALAVFLFSLPSSAYAADPLTETLCVVVNWLTGRMGQAIATLGILVIGIGAMLGKISWPVAITVTIGITIMFSGARVVELLTSQAAEGICGGGGIDAGVMEDALCALAGWSQKPIGRALGAIAVCFVGISAMIGKVSWEMALVTAVGISAFYGAEPIARHISTGMGITWIGCSLG